MVSQFQNRRFFLFFFVSVLFVVLISCNTEQKTSKSPNILFAISDDQSFAHTSFAGCSFIETPAFDRVATEGVYFTNCIAGSPGCAPSPREWWLPLPGPHAREVQRSHHIHC